MIKEAINRILEIDKRIITEEIDGRLYTKGGLQRIDRPEESSPDAPIFNTLTGLIDFASLFKPPISDSGGLFFYVCSPEKVQLCGSFQPSNYNKRFVYAKAYLDHEIFRFANESSPAWHTIEMFVIGIQALFVATDQRESVIDMLGSVANEAIQENTDDGFSQTLQVRTGIRHRERETVKNPIALKPWRTFREVDQPESAFILRFSNKNGMQCSLWEADGGMWRSEAMQNIKAWLNGSSEIMAIA